MKYRAHLFDSIRYTFMIWKQPALTTLRNTHATCLSFQFWFGKLKAWSGSDSCVNVGDTQLFLKIYIYPPNRRKTSEALYIGQVNNPDLLPEMARYCCPVEIFSLVF